MPRASVNGIEISFETAGAGRPAVFIHGGFGGAQGTLTPAPKPINDVAHDGFQLITFDRRNAGQSEYVLDWFDLGDIAADVRALLDHIGVDAAVVIGSSMGGMVALEFTRRFADAVAALALVNTGADLMSATPWGQGLAAQVAYCRSEGDAASFARHRERLRNPPLNVPETADAARRAVIEAAHERHVAALADASDDNLQRWHAGMLRNANAFLGHDLAPTLSAITAPTFIVHGTADDVVPFRYGERLRDAIPHSEFYAVNGAGHGILQHAEARRLLGVWLAGLH